MPKISQLSSATPTTGAEFAAVINSTTVRFTLQQALAQPTTATGDILYRNSSGEMTKLPAGSSGTYLKESSVGLPTWVPRQWGLSASWKAPSASDVACFEVPFNLTVSDWRLGGDSAGSVTVEIRKDAFSSTPAASGANVSSAGPVVALANAQRSSGNVSSWSDVAWDKGEWITLYLSGPSSLSYMWLSLAGTERAS